MPFNVFANLVITFIVLVEHFFLFFIYDYFWLLSHSIHLIVRVHRAFSLQSNRFLYYFNYPHCLFYHFVSYIMQTLLFFIFKHISGQVDPMHTAYKLPLLKNNVVIDTVKFNNNNKTSRTLTIWHTLACVFHGFRNYHHYREYVWYFYLNIIVVVEQNVFSRAFIKSACILLACIIGWQWKRFS